MVSVHMELRNASKAVQQTAGWCSTGHLQHQLLAADNSPAPAAPTPTRTQQPRSAGGSRNPIPAHALNPHCIYRVRLLHVPNHRGSLGQNRQLGNPRA